MFSSVGPGDEAAALALYEAGVTALITVAQANPTGASILELLRGLETGRNRLATAEHALIADAEAQGLPHEHACPSTPNWLSQLLRINPAEATARVKAAADLGPRRGLTGEQLPPIFEQVAAAQASGEISAAHARVITRCVDALPAAVQAEHDLAVQASLVEHAHTLNPRQLG
ncbi:MAG: hypothetical protein QOF87_1978, partial [Pseudonocardiales bacterium]|nr:hypothetical protein [Pseudonocardiales bacterium]